MAIRERNPRDWLFWSLCAASILFMLLPVSAPVQTLRLLGTYVLHPVPVWTEAGSEYAQRVPKTVLDLLRADQENRILRARVREDAALREHVEALSEENRRLREALAIEPPPGWGSLWTRVVEREPASWYRSLLVDKGRLDGVELNAPVLGVEDGSAGVVGRVVEVRRTTSKVLLATDELSHAAVSVGAEGWEGLATGTGRDRIHVRYLPQEALLSPGDEVRTSAVSTTFPSGLPLGRIVEVFPKDPVLTFQTVEVEPAVRHERLVELLVLRRPEGLAPMGPLPSSEPEAPGPTEPAPGEAG